jgi:hypothetical protein
MACPHLYTVAVIGGQRDAENQYSLRGTQVHEAMSDYINHLVATRKADDREWYQANILTRPYLQDAIEILGSLVGWVKVDPEKVLGTEMYLALDEEFEPIDFDIDDGGQMSPMAGADVAFEGTLDYIQCPSANEAEIWDWKSFFQIVDADTFQSRLYPLLLLKHYPALQLVRFHLQFVRYGVSRSVEYTREQVPELEAEAKRYRTRQLRLHAAADVPTDELDPATEYDVKGKYLGAMPGNHCIYCPKLTASLGAMLIAKSAGTTAGIDPSKICPIAEINPFVAHSVEDRVRYGVWISQAARENARVLREHVKINGPVEIEDANGQKYSARYDATASVRYPAGETIDMLKIWKEASGEDLLAKVYVGATELAPLLKAKKRSALVEKLEPITVVIPGTEWAIGKVEEEK